MIDGVSTIGGGSAPGSELPTRLVAIAAPDVIRIEAALRGGDPPVIARIEHDRLVFDLRTVPAGHDERLGALISAAIPVKSPGSVLTGP